MIGRFLLPVFGGTAMVWVTCLVAFQFLLLAGYFYAMLNVRRKVHISLLLVAAIWMVSLPFVGRLLSHFFAAFPPSMGVLLDVLALVGFPYVLLSANTTLVQKWSGDASRDVYRLYAIGNAGSFAGLFAYPLFVEPFLSVTVQQVLVAFGIFVYAAMLFKLGSRGEVVENVGCAQDDSTRKSDVVPFESKILSHPILWVLLPLVTCFLLTATTTHLSTDFVPLPLLWAFILGAFLLSYIIGFSRIGEKYLIVWMFLSVPVLGFAVWAAMPHKGYTTLQNLIMNATAAIFLFLVVSTCLHSWLCRIRPETDGLGRFYFCGALGGAMGGLLAGVVPPLCFSFILEYPLALAMLMGVLAMLVHFCRRPDLGSLNNAALVGLGITFVGVLPLLDGAGRAEGETLCRARDFYNCVTIKRVNGMMSNGRKIPKNVIFHGGTMHGMQLVEDPLHPTTYYGITGGAIAFNMHPDYGNRPLRIGMAGLGVGVLAVWANTNDVFRCYEISPVVISTACNTNYFTFLSQCPAKVEIVPGDARLALEREDAAGDEKLDILIVDVFSGDSIPLHLISQEAFRLYKRRLAKDGILAVHISNWHINLWPLCKGAGEMMDFNILGTISGAVISEFVDETLWVFYSEKPFTLPRLPTCVKFVDFSKIESHLPPKDNCGSLLRYCTFNTMPPLKGKEQ